MKRLAIWALCLLGCPLFSEVVDQVKIDFPPSKNEWKLLLELHEKDFLDDDEALEFEEEEETFHMKSFCHREGDALETFVVVFTEENEEENKADDAEMEKFLKETMGKYFPNHTVSMRTWEDTLTEWELNDDSMDLIHGYSRKMELPNGKVALLGYSTTALKSEANRTLWLSVLNQAYCVE